MTCDTKQCIYCSTLFDPTVGEGDHILPAALGEFSGFETFRGSCNSCNNLFGHSEEEIVRCGPEAYLARVSDPPRRRARGGKAWTATKNAKPPAMFNERFGARLVVKPVTRDPRNVETVDQLVVITETGEQFPIMLYVGMSAKDIKDRIAALKVQGKMEVHFNVAEKHMDWFNSILPILFPDALVHDLPPTEVGVQRVQSLIQFKVSDHYFRALAKTAFHYYLQYNGVGIRGDEPEFEGVRQFISKGGNMESFFKTAAEVPVIFSTPFGDMPCGGIVQPSGWGHMLAADDSTGIVVVFLHLFLGPEHVLPPKYLILGTRPRAARCSEAWSHLLRWEPGSSSKGSTQCVKLGRGYPQQVISGPRLANIDRRCWPGQVV